MTVVKKKLAKFVALARDSYYRELSFIQFKGAIMKQPESANWALDTIFVHGGQDHRLPELAGTPTSQPIYVSTTYLHSDAEALDQAFNRSTSRRSTGLCQLARAIPMPGNSSDDGKG